MKNKAELIKVQQSKNEKKIKRMSSARITALRISEAKILKQKKAPKGQSYLNS